MEGGLNGILEMAVLGGCMQLPKALLPPAMHALN